MARSGRMGARGRRRGRELDKKGGKRQTYKG